MKMTPLYRLFSLSLIEETMNNDGIRRKSVTGIYLTSLPSDFAGPQETVAAVFCSSGFKIAGVAFKWQLPENDIEGIQKCFDDPIKPG